MLPSAISTSSLSRDPLRRRPPIRDVDEKEKAFGLLEKAIQNKSRVIFRIKTEPRLDNLRDDPRYQDIIKKIGFPE